MNKRERFSLVQKANSNERTKALVKETCRRNINFFFNALLFTYDPRRSIDKNCCFELWDFQKKFLIELEYCYQNKEPLLVEKSRDMGFSWLFLGWTLHKMLFIEGFSAGIGSRKALLVDEKGSMRSLMERVRFMLERLPKWLRGGYNDYHHSKVGQIRIPSTGAILSGEGGDNIGRGDRTSIYFLDEWAHVPRSSIVHEAVSQTTDCLVYGSTPNGKGNEFARLRWQTKIRRFTMHWENHPNKNQEWYNKQKLTLTKEQIAQELDISYAKSTKGRVYKWFDALVHAHKRQTYNNDHPVFITFDWGIGDPTACLFIQDYGGTIKIIDHFEQADQDIDYIFTELVKPRLNRMKLKTGRNLDFRDVSGWYGDPDGKNRNLITGKSLSDYIFKQYNVKLRYKLPNHIGPRILSVRKMGAANRILVDSSLTFVHDCIENYKYPDKEHGENEKPLHDWTSHTCSALEYFMVYEYPLEGRKQRSTITTSRFR